MSTTEPDDEIGPQSRPAYPAIEDLPVQTVKKTPHAADRIFWDFDAPWPESISVMKDSKSPDSLTPYFQDGAWHEIAQEPLTEPKVSSITVVIDLFDYYETNWIERHFEDLDNIWGDLPDYDPAKDYSPAKVGDREQHLLYCCGEHRPRNIAKVNIVVKPAVEGGFITVHDYLSTVHPWLTEHKQNIIKAETVWETKFPESVVDFWQLIRVKITKKEDWVRRVSGVPFWSGSVADVEEFVQIHGFSPLPPWHSLPPNFPQHSIFPTHPADKKPPGYQIFPNRILQGHHRVQGHDC